MPGSNERIVYPTVPQKEQGPRARINVMIDIFNASLPSQESRGRLDEGLLHEIETARDLVARHYITHGRQISRPLTATEKFSGQKGNSQMIMVPMEGHFFRELDMVYERGGTTHIVEAKNTRTPDHSQLENNLYLAMALPTKTKVVYAVRRAQEEALQAAYDSLTLRHPTLRDLAPFEVIRIPELLFRELRLPRAPSFADEYFKGYVTEIDHVPIGRPFYDFGDGNPDAGDEPQYDVTDLSYQ
jgi:hypothetical protein